MRVCTFDNLFHFDSRVPHFKLCSISYICFDILLNKMFHKSKLVCSKFLTKQNHVFPSSSSLSHESFICYRMLSTITTPTSDAKKSYKLIVVGGGAGGISVAARFARRLNKSEIAVIEPSNDHYYQPLWTLVGAGIKQLPSTRKPTASVIPKNVDWIQDRCVEINPKQNEIRLSGTLGPIKYDYLVLAAGIQLDWNKIEGLTEALETPGVCSNYSGATVNKTFKAIQGLGQGNGNAIFTFPNTPIKCAGAPQKIMYLTDAHLRQHGNRNSTTIFYNTSLPTIFGVKHYATALSKICADRNLNVNTRLNLVRVEPLRKVAYFQQLDNPDRALVEYPYRMLHVTPPMSAPSFLVPLSNATSNGFVAVDPKSLQHLEYPNVFSLGDCSSLPTSKTAAAIASQNYILEQNLLEVMKNGNAKKLEHYPQSYDGYTSCPLVTGFNKCILAEFDYNGQPLETFPLSQAVERTSMYYMKKDALPFIYWNAMLKGHWRGPGIFRKIAHLGMGN